MKQKLLTISKNAEQLVEEYPDFKVKGYSSYLVMSGDLVVMDTKGRLERVTKGQISEVNGEYVFEVEDSVLIDEGLEVGK